MGKERLLGMHMPGKNSGGVMCVLKGPPICTLARTLTRDGAVLCLKRGVETSTCKACGGCGWAIGNRRDLIWPGT